MTVTYVHLYKQHLGFGSISLTLLDSLCGVRPLSSLSSLSLPLSLGAASRWWRWATPPVRVATHMADPPGGGGGPPPSTTSRCGGRGRMRRWVAESSVGRQDPMAVGRSPGIGGCARGGGGPLPLHQLQMRRERAQWLRAARSGGGRLLPWRWWLCSRRRCQRRRHVWGLQA